MVRTLALVALLLPMAACGSDEKAAGAPSPSPTAALAKEATSIVENADKLTRHLP